jgi:hypothetical protein
MSNPTVATAPIVAEPTQADNFKLKSSPDNTVLAAQKNKLEKLLETLNGLIKTLPTSISGGRKDGPIAKQFTNQEYDVTEGSYFTFNKAWERVFQVPDDEKERQITRGKQGSDLIYMYLLHFSKIPQMEMNNGLFLMAERVEALIRIIQIV